VRSASFGLAVLSFINLFSYLDRYIVSALIESLKHSELGLSDANLGSLMSAFLVVYTFTAPVFGALGDRRSRPRLIAIGVACWSIATALSGFATGYLTLLAARASVGVGEAAYVTIAPSLLSDYFPMRQRGRVMAIFFCAIPVGSALGYVVGGLVDKHYGWRSAFFVAGIPGVLLAALCLLLRDPPRGAQDGTAARAGSAAGAKPASKAPRANIGKDTWAAYGRLVRNRPYALTVLGYAAYTFAVGGLAVWMPAFLERARGIPRDDATVGFGAIVVITGFIGTFVGG
jgi:MFS family permease